MTADFRLATQADSPAMLAVLRAASEDFAAAGIDQWQNGHPSPAAVEADIDSGAAFVLLYDGVLAATGVLSFAPEPDYSRIQGAWHTGGHTAAVHRFAAARAYKGSGAAALLMQNFIRVARDANLDALRVDTHRNNARMRGFLKKHGFVYCGVIHLADFGNAERLAFDLALKGGEGNT